MQRRPRKVNARQRNPRASRNPAYQIRPRYHLASDNAEGRTEQWDIEAPVDSDAEWRKPEEPVEEPAEDSTDTPAEADDPEATSYQPEVPDYDEDEDEPEEATPEPVEPVEATVDDDDGDDTEASKAPEDEEDAAEPVTTAATNGDTGDIEATTEAVAVTPPADEDEPEDFAAYVRKIEEAAARSRAERRGTALAGPRPAAAVAQHPAASISTQQAPAVSGRRRNRRHPAAGQQGGGKRGGRGGRGGPPVAEKPFFKRRKTWLIILALLVLIPLIVVGLWAGNVLRLGINAWGDIHTPREDRISYRVNAMGTPEAVPEEEAEAALPDWDADDIVNIVLMGVDVESENGSVRSDTIIVVNINPATDEISMMSIPRDLQVYIPEFGDEKMNAAYAIGHANQDTIPGGGPTLVAQTIEANFNIPIHYYATVDFYGFQEIVDTVGGVVVDVQAQLSDNLYPTEDLRLTRIYFGSGLQKLNGQEALQYVRTRHADSDLARGQRQQEVLLAIRERAVVRDLITKAPDLIEDFADTVRTDLNFNQLLALANLGRGIDPANIARVDLWQEGILTEHFPEFEGDAYYLMADWERVWQVQAEYFDAPLPTETPTPESVAEEPASDPDQTEPEDEATEVAEEPNLDTPVMVENGTDVEMLAGLTTQFLFDSGFTQVWAADAEEPTPTTVIYDSSDNPLTARHLCELLDLNPSVIVPRDGNGDITVVIGDDFPRPSDDPEDEDVEP